MVANFRILGSRSLAEDMLDVALFGRRRPMLMMKMMTILLFKVWRRSWVLPCLGGGGRINAASSCCTGQCWSPPSHPARQSLCGGETRIQKKNMGKSVTEPLVYVLVHCAIMRKTFCEEQNHLDPAGSIVRYEMMKLRTGSV